MTILCSHRKILSFNIISNYYKYPTKTYFYIPRSNFHKSTSLQRYYEDNPKGRYLNPNLSKEAFQEQRAKLFGLKDGFKDIRVEIGRWANEWKEKLTDDTNLYVLHGDRTIVWKFDSPDFKKTWLSVSDSDHGEGYSRCGLDMSPTGKAQFHGFVSSKTPQDGKIQKAGYCSMRCQRITKSFHRDSYLDWEAYSHLVMRVRGDGRSYIINISTAGFFDITWNDCFHYVLYTRGGPYWQYVKIPFSKFVFGSKGRVQDMQDRIPLYRIASFGIAAGQVDGPFNLEIDWIGVELDNANEEEFAYEMYRIPPFVANV